MADSKQKAVQTAIPEVPVTIERPPYNPGVNQRKELPNAGTARVNKAASVKAPDGTPEWAEQHSSQTVLQQHCDFFDRDHDGIIWPYDTFRGFHLLGFNILTSFIAMVFIHVLFSYSTCPTIIPDPFFRIFLYNIHKSKHGSDSGAFDNEGRFVPQKFEDFFTKYSKGKDCLALNDIAEGLKGQRLLMDPIGWLGAAAAWISTYMLLWPEDGCLKKEDVRRVFDGSIFYEIASKKDKSGKAKAA